jgi:hypothetical protein
MLAAMLVVALGATLWVYAPMAVLGTLAFGVLSAVGTGTVLLLGACLCLFRANSKDH